MAEAGRLKADAEPLAIGVDLALELKAKRPRDGQGTVCPGCNTRVRKQHNLDRVAEAERDGSERLEELEQRVFGVTEARRWLAS